MAQLIQFKRRAAIGKPDILLAGEPLYNVAENAFYIGTGSAVVRFDAGAFNGDCSTAAATAAKVVACPGIVLLKGVEVTIKFTETNTVAPASLRLNVGGTGAKEIKYRGANLPSANVLSENRTYKFRYNGTDEWELIGDLDTDTTVGAALSSHTGDSTIHITGAERTKWDGVVTDFAGLEIGGRNLAKNTEERILTPKNTGGAVDNYNYERFYYDVKSNTTYTISFESEVTHGEYSAVTIIGAYQGGRSVKVELNLNGRTKHTFTTPQNTSATSALVYAGIAGETRGNGLILRNIKIEKGNKATDWSPAPEDQVSDWNTTNVDSFSFIKNKPTLLSQFTDNIGVAIHIANTSNPHSVTKAQVGLGNVDNTADVNKNVLSATKLIQINSYDANDVVGGASFNYGSISYWINAPTGMSYGGIGNVISRGTNVLSLQLAFDINHNSESSTKDLWFRSGNNLGFQNDWKKVWHSGNLTSLSQLTDNIGVATHIANTSNPHSVTKEQVGLGSVENTALSTYAGSTTQDWSAKSLTLKGAITGATSGLFSSTITANNFVASASSGFMFTASKATRFNGFSAPIAGGFLFCVNGAALTDTPALQMLPGNYVGINTTTPSYNLDVTGTGRITSNLSVGGTLGVTGNTTLSGTLDVIGSVKIPDSKYLQIGSARLTYETVGGVGFLKLAHSDTVTPMHLVTTGGQTMYSTGVPAIGGGGGAIIQLNGVTLGEGETAAFYAPTTAGANGNILKSNGSGAPSWVTMPEASLSVAGITTLGAAGGAAAYSHTHSAYSLTSHNHTGIYAAASHGHATLLYTELLYTDSYSDTHNVLGYSGTSEYDITLGNDTYKTIIDGSLIVLEPFISYTGLVKCTNGTLSVDTNTYLTGITKTMVDAVSCNADTVDSLHATSFLRSDAANSSDIVIATTNGLGIRFWNNNNHKIFMAATANTTYGNRIYGDTTSDYNMYFRIGDGTNRGFVFESSYSVKLASINPDGIRSNVGMTFNSGTIKGAVIGNYGVCSTAGGTAAKEVTIDGFRLVTGVSVYIKFSNTITTGSSTTLNINGTGAKNINLPGMAYPGLLSSVYAGDVLNLVYDGATYRVVWFAQYGS